MYLFIVGFGTTQYSSNTVLVFVAHTEHPLSTTGDQLNKRMDVMVDLGKATNHPLLLRHHYTDDTLHCMVRAILMESSHRDAAPNLVWETRV